MSIESRLARALTPLASLLIAAPLVAQLGPVDTQFWDQSSPGLGIAMESGANMGYGLAAGDFDCDGFDDLAIGMPGEDLVGGVNAGRLIVLYSTATGPVAAGNQIWGQNSPVIEDDAEPNDRFSEVLVAGDFDGDGCGDLAIGVPAEDIGAEGNAGAVNVLYGGPDGLTGDFDDFWHQDLEPIAGAAEAADLFGGALAAGDFDDDGFDDLAIGVPGEDIESENATQAGAVHILWGSGSGLTASGSLLLYRGNGLSGTPQDGEALGGALAAGDFVPLFAGDDLAVGAPGRDVASFDQAGAVVLVSDLAGSLFDSTYSQDTDGVPGLPEEFDRFGSPLAAGDFDGDGLVELAVGIRGEDLENPLVGSVGAVNVLDFDGDTMQLWLQDDLAPEQSEIGDEFGAALAVGDFDADGVDDLAIGVPQENLGPVIDGGLIHVLYGQAGSGLGIAGRQLWLQTINPSDSDDQFGFALAVGRFSGHSGTDLAIGVPFETIGAFTETGGVNVLFSIALFVDGFESGDTSRWSLEQN